LQKSFIHKTKGFWSFKSSTSIMNFIIKKSEEALCTVRSIFSGAPLMGWWHRYQICYPTSLVKMYFEYYFIMTPFKYIETWTNQCDCSIKGSRLPISSLWKSSHYWIILSTPNLVGLYTYTIGSFFLLSI